MVLAFKPSNKSPKSSITNIFDVIFSFQWDRENLLLSAERIISKVKENITSKILVIDDLGDLLSCQSKLLNHPINTF